MTVLFRRNTVHSFSVLNIHNFNCFYVTYQFSCTCTYQTTLLCGPELMLLFVCRRLCQHTWVITLIEASHLCCCSGNEIGRDVITIKSCACPLRDLQKELNSGAGREEMLLLLLLLLLLLSLLLLSLLSLLLLLLLSLLLLLLLLLLLTLPLLMLLFSVSSTSRIVVFVVIILCHWWLCLRCRLSSTHPSHSTSPHLLLTPPPSPTYPPTHTHTHTHTHTQVAQDPGEEGRCQLSHMQHQMKAIFLLFRSSLS